MLYLIIDENEGNNTNNEDNIKIKTFENTSSTRLELQTLLWALGELLDTVKKVIIHTDYQNIIKLPDRCISLEDNDYK